MLSEIIQTQARISPNRTFLYQPSSNEEISFGRLWEVSKAIYCSAEIAELPEGSRIILISRNHWFLYPLLVSCSMRRHILVPVNPALHSDEMSFVLSHAQPSLIILEEGLQIKPLSTSVPICGITAFMNHSTSTLTKLTVPSGADPGLLLIYTSGTSGGAKAVLLTEENLVSMARIFSAYYSIQNTDKLFCVLPTYHLNAVMLTGLLPLISGAQVVLSRPFHFTNAKFFWDDVARYQITICSLVPSIMAMLLEISKQSSSIPLNVVRFGFCGAAPLGASLWREFESRFGFPIYQGYGLTETSGWATGAPIGPRKYDSVGKPLGCEVQIEGESSDNAGEVLIRGPIVMKEYYRNKSLTQATLRSDGFMRTGDLGFIDNSGYLHITGRIKEIIIRNGINISPPDIDDILAHHPSILASKTLGVPDKIRGERVHSVCVLREGIRESAQSIISWLRDNLSEYKRPDDISIMGYLPKSPTGKVSTHTLRKIISGEIVDEIFKSLTSKKYRRAHPFDPDGIRRVIRKAVGNGSPLSFLSLWGCGQRSSVTAVDYAAFSRLIEFITLADRIAEVPSRLTLILTDLHGEHNGIPVAQSTCYFEEIRKMAKERQVKCISMSDLWKKASMSFEVVDKLMAQPEFRNRWRELPIKSNLIEQALKHYRKDDRFEWGAMRYFQMCLVDDQILTRTFPDAIFLTYNSSEMDAILPQLPRMYLFSSKSGCCDKPWFQGDEIEL